MILVLGAVIKTTLSNGHSHNTGESHEFSNTRPCPQGTTPNREILVAAIILNYHVKNLQLLPGRMFCPIDFRMTASLMLNIYCVLSEFY